MTRELALHDDAARAQALDVTGSWLVQAPAGSGKTGLLIQRYLALLARVTHPERIVAMTFTRKAAAEMRERILEALVDAAADRPIPSSSTHEQQTRELARAALAQDARHGWALREHPARLRIMTIDALATAIARQAPVHSGLGALPNFVDDARPLYREAARLALTSARGDDAHWRVFLQWLDNDANTAVELLSQMLAARDRWPTGMNYGDNPALRAGLEALLTDEICTALHDLRALVPGALAARFAVSAQHAAIQLASEGDAELGQVLAQFASRGELPAAAPEALASWRNLASWLLTQQGEFLKQISVRHGFPATKSSDARARKAAFVDCIADAAKIPGLAAALHGVRMLPAPRFSDDAWTFVTAVLSVLPQVAATLLTVFAAHGECDFAEATLRALAALGGPDDPSDLLLALDYRLDHLLVDEFQDTSAAQLALIERLTAGWQCGDGRTLFAVGDPMQSIYRFREAEVRIFVEAQARSRVAQVDLGVLELARNFRSQRALVEWVNDVFPRVLPPSSNAMRGEVAYRAAAPASDRASEAEPRLMLVLDRRAEADAVVEEIRAAQAAGCARIAILVRARTHADFLLPALRRAGIVYAAVELEALDERLATRDLCSLARALAQPADRLAWLAVLRAPWCGLPLGDLLIISQAPGTVAQALHDNAVLARMSQDARVRARRLTAALEAPLASRGRMDFHARVRCAWLALGGPACGEGGLDREGADRFFSLLQQHERAGDLADYDAFTTATADLYAPVPDDPDSTAVQVMTLHKAKGLEFDAVLLPGLDRGAGGSDDPLLRFKVRRGGTREGILLAPRRARIGALAEPDPVYAYLRALDSAEETAELARLLYVGATRAKQRLSLIAVARVHEEPKKPPRWRSPARGTPLERMWSALSGRLPPVPGQSSSNRDEDLAEEESREAPPLASSLVRLPADFSMPELPPAVPSPVILPIVRSEIPFNWADVAAAAVGTVAHRLLAQIGREGLAEWDEQRVRAQRKRVAVELMLEGVDPAARPEATARVVEVATRTLADQRGRWLFAQSHVDARSEWALAGFDQAALAHIVIDRTFIDNGVRWIVDFKTGRHEGGDIDAFLAREVTRYQPQLARYARIVAALDPRPIRLALYYPLVAGGWREFDTSARDA